jgi:hypothetical protein
LRRLAIASLVLGLLLGTTAAFAVTQALKLERSPIKQPRFSHAFSPTCGCRQDTARLAFVLNQADTIDVDVVDDDGDPVRRLVDGESRSAGPVVLRWDGMSDDGAVVADGVYRLRIDLADDGRTIVIPQRIRVDTEPPTVEVQELDARQLSPDGDGVRDSARVQFTTSEAGRAVLLVDGRGAQGRRLAESGPASFVWQGDVRDRPLRAGVYEVAVQVQDAAGNVSGAAAAATVRIRFIEIVQERLTVPRGGVLRFRVRTDVARFRVTVSRRTIGGRPAVSESVDATRVALPLPRRLAPGRYVLRVTAGDHSDQASIRIRARR